MVDFVRNTHGHVVKMPLAAGTTQYMALCWLKLWFIASTYQERFLIRSNEAQVSKARK